MYAPLNIGSVPMFNNISFNVKDWRINYFFVLHHNFLCNTYKFKAYKKRICSSYGILLGFDFIVCLNYCK